ncbi:MAG TPA: hypothetical protein VNL95_03135 [Dehalococcoidia bacterium]|nr:hypothetical protein [Dehalococcoidia bacterium]
MRLLVYRHGALRAVSPREMGRLLERFAQGEDPVPCAGDGPCPARPERLVLLEAAGAAAIALFLCPACYQDFKGRARAELGLVPREVVGAAEMPVTGGWG